MEGLRRQVESARATSAQVRERLSLHGPTAVYLGALRADKRLDLLLVAAERISSRIAGFTLIIGGDGPERRVIDTALATSPWLRYVGPVFGWDKAAILASADVLLQPAAMGLVVLDAYAAGLPVVTFDRASHSPEEEYLRDGIEGIRVPGTDSTAFADAVVRLLDDPAIRDVLARGAMAAGSTHSIEDMARRFAEGIEAALR